MKLLKIIYIASILPLVSGSFIFLYWFYKRTSFAENVVIEVPAFFALVGFLLCSILVLILCIVFIIKNKKEWKKIIIPLTIMGVTIPVIDVYGTMHRELSQKAFVRVVNDTNQRINRIWSDHFEITYSQNYEKEYIFSFYPVYTYDWEQITRSYHPYKISVIHMDVFQKGTVVTLDLSELPKGECKTIKVSQLNNKGNK
jgi:hypothetical protein